MNTDSRIMSVSSGAYDKIAAIIEDTAQEGEQLALLIAIAGLNGTEFAYELHMTPVDALEDGDHVERHDNLTIAIAQDSVANLTGATLTMSRNLLKPGLAIDNPNGPSPAILGSGPPLDPSLPVVEQTEQVIAGQINPALASHGGSVELVAVEGSTAYVRLGGGCQGCGMANVTLSQGIEATITSQVEGIVAVVDVTDHNSGENPFYESSKK